MEKLDIIQAKFKLKKALASSIDVLISEELKTEELTFRVKNLVDNILPNTDMYLKSVVVSYAKAKLSLYLNENILNNAISEYKLELEVSDDEARN